ncbi:MAG TPA: GNAT family N-acetyltransferase [Candidatus Paceibacterota bacterium]|nr:GNAT family N-acetyltransferase [Candidatus Paceibacterota bacterium]
MKIIPLSEEYLDEAIALCNKVFPDDIKTENPPELGFKESLFKEEYNWAWDKYYIARVEYYLLISEIGKVIGTTGVYQNTIEPESAWVGWFCVDPKERRKGYGEMLLNFTIQKAKGYNYRFLKLYTDPEESPEAKNLYKKLGFLLEKTDLDPSTGKEVTILKKTL